MAKISESKGRRDENSGYARLFGNQELGQLLSRMQATVIRSGNGLEKLIEDLTPDSLKTEPKSVGITTPVLPGKQVIFHLRVLGSSGERASSADIVFIEHKERRATIIELKDGDTFDTKKASGELDSMQKVASWLSDRLGYNTTIAFCAFNQPDKESIMRGAKDVLIESKL